MDAEMEASACSLEIGFWYVWVFPLLIQVFVSKPRTEGLTLTHHLRFKFSKCTKCGRKEF